MWIILTRAILLRVVLAALLFSGIALAQEPSAQTNNAQPTSAPSDTPTPVTNSQAPNSEASKPQPHADAFTIPAGSRIPITLKQAISTKNAREGDSVYAETVFPFVLNERVLVPSGTYVQGKIAHVERAGHGKGRSELLMHFTTLIYPSGYTLMLPASVENTPGADDKGVKDKEGTIQQDKDTGKKLEESAKNGVYGTVGGATAGSLATGSLNGARVGAGVGAVTGVAWALLKRGPDVKLEVGTSIEMEIQRPIAIDPARITVAKATP
jgi:Bacterial conjugation TrbI-like protein